MLTPSQSCGMSLAMWDRTVYLLPDASEQVSVPVMRYCYLFQIRGYPYMIFHASVGNGFQVD